jgi:hypothetical protein
MNDYEAVQRRSRKTGGTALQGLRSGTVQQRCGFAASYRMPALRLR